MEINPPIKVDRLLTNKLDDAFRFPTTLSVEAMLDEALDKKPPVNADKLATPKVLFKVAAPLTNNDDEALSAPATCNPAATDEEAPEKKPFVEVMKVVVTAVN